MQPLNAEHSPYSRLREEEQMMEMKNYAESSCNLKYRRVLAYCPSTEYKVYFIGPGVDLFLVEQEIDSANNAGWYHFKWAAVA